MCHLQLKLTISKIELLISTAQPLYPSPRHILSRSCLSQENSSIYLAVLVNPSITPEHLSCKIHLDRTHLAFSTIIILVQTAVLSHSDPCSSLLSVSMFLLEMVWRCNSDHTSPYSLRRLPLPLMINFNSLTLADTDWCDLTPVYLSVLFTSLPTVPQAHWSFCPPCTKLIPFSGLHELSSPSFTQDWLFVFNYIILNVTSSKGLS